MKEFLHGVGRLLDDWLFPPPMSCICCGTSSARFGSTGSDEMKNRVSLVVFPVLLSYTTDSTMQTLLKPAHLSLSSNQSMSSVCQHVRVSTRPWPLSTVFAFLNFALNAGSCMNARISSCSSTGCP